jgi:2-dehydropantoate 2-reductase
MKICIFGAGAVGSMIGGELARASQDVTLITRGPHLRAMQENGLTVNMNGTEHHTRPTCTDDPGEPGIQDFVIFTVKAHQAADAAEQAAPLMGPDTTIVAAQNGVPWWYFYGTGDDYENHRLKSIDADRRIWNAIGPERVLGGMINGSCGIAKPGYVNHTQKYRALTIGEPSSSGSDRCEALASAFAKTDIDMPVATDIRHVVWTKLLSNVAGSMICVLTRGAQGETASDPSCRALAANIMREAGVIAAALGIDLSREIAAKIADEGPRNSPHKPSTLQDLEAGKAMEIDDIVGAVAEIGRLVGVESPMIEAIYTLLRRTAEVAGCYPGDGSFTLIPRA